MLRFQVDKFTITKLCDPSPASHNIDHLQAAFTFTDEWTEQPFAIFKGSGKCIKQMIVDGVCMVPWEVLQNKGYVYVSCFAGMRITSNVAQFYVDDSGYCQADNEHEPTPEVYDQIIAYFDSIKADVLEAQAAAEDAADRAEQAASEAGYMFFYVDENGHLIYERTTNTEVDFYLSNGNLYVEAVA